MDELLSSVPLSVHHCSRVFGQSLQLLHLVHQSLETHPLHPEKINNSCVNVAQTTIKKRNRSSVIEIKTRKLNVSTG